MIKWNLKADNKLIKFLKHMCASIKEEIKNILAVILGFFLIVLIVSAAIDIKDKIQISESAIVVSDTGIIYAKPDLGLITASVVTEAETVAEAMSENTEKINAIISAVKEEGVEEKDLKTVSFNIYPRYEWIEASLFSSRDFGGQRVLVGYEVRQSLEIKIRNMEKIGSVIQTATDRGANQISDLQLTFDNQDKLKAQAREQAINKAKAKAEELARQLGVKLVGISDFSETGVVPYYYALEKSSLPMGMGGADESPLIESGENKIEITVYITYKIR